MYFCTMKKTAPFYILLFLSVVVLMQSCSDYKKILKSTDVEMKYEKAIEYYQKGDYFRAIQLFDELLTYFRGTQRAEDIYYYYAYAHYGKGDYLLASFFFKNFSNTFPRSKYTEETMFMSAYCDYLDSPIYSLDQTNTKNAIRGMQNFINSFPNSEKVPQANEVIDNLRQKLQKKSFEIARLYLTIEQYNAAITAFNTHMKDYPDSKFKEDAYFLIFKAHYLYASKSIETRKRERFNSAKEAYENFASLYPDSKFNREAETFHRITLRELNKYNNN